MADIPFSSYAFPATGEPTDRTMAARLADVKNVKDFGAVGNGVTDDLAAITAAINWQISTTSRSTIYFPPGTYLVSAPIDVSGLFSELVGCLGLSTIIGNFADYIIKKYILAASGTGTLYVEKLTLVNSNALGGGIRIGESVGASVRDCDITANFGIDTDNSDVFGPPGAPGSYWGSLEVMIENCDLRAYTALAANSTGLSRDADGPTNNCTFTNFDTAVRTFGGQGGMPFYGCYFETNNIGIANSSGPYPAVPDMAGGTGGVGIIGCYFKNNGIAIAYVSGVSRYSGILIDGTEGAIAGGNPQYGIFVVSGASCAFEGIKIVGQYEMAGVHLAGGEATASPSFWAGVSVTNTSTLGGVAWDMPTTATSMDIQECNVSNVWTMAQIPAKTYSIASATWSGGTATITVVGGSGDLPTGSPMNVTVAGVTPSGYNGYFAGALAIQFNQFTYTVANPGGSGTVFGTAFETNVGNAGRPNAFEGYCFNVSNADTATWGAAAVSTGSNHCKLRFTPAAWTVVGK